MCSISLVLLHVENGQALCDHLYCPEVCVNWLHGAEDSTYMENYELEYSKSDTMRVDKNRGKCLYLETFFKVTV